MFKVNNKDTRTTSLHFPKNLALLQELRIKQYHTHQQGLRQCHVDHPDRPTQLFF